MMIFPKNFPESGLNHVNCTTYTRERQKEFDSWTVESLVTLIILLMRIWMSSFCFVFCIAAFEAQFLFWCTRYIIFTSLNDISQVILQSEAIQELNKTSQALGLLQEEASELRKLSDAQKSENVTHGSFVFCNSF